MTLDLGPEQALLALADEPELRCLHGGPDGAVLVAWGGPVQELPGLDGLCPPPGHLLGDSSTSWNPCAGGALVRLDYECPVGPWALSLPCARPPGQLWPLRAHLRWSRPDAACELIGTPAEQESMRARLSTPASAGRGGIAPSNRGLPALRVLAGPSPAWTRSGHRARVEELRLAIAAGALYQANLTCPIRLRLAPGPHRDLSLFLAVQAAAPGGYAAFLRSEGSSVISHSPECFLLAMGDRAVCEPIKGTRRRRPGQEAEARAALAASAKDHAELAMIVDLVRNDLGRCAVPGGVTVSDPARVVDLAYVHHLVARIEATLAPGKDLRALLAATFPAGSITGAPKIAAMQRIRDLEGAPRGAYCGTVGWLASDAAQLAVAIRTAEVSGDEVRIQAGGGITADSDGDAEWAELLAKAAPLLTACGADPAALEAAS